MRMSTTACGRHFRLIVVGGGAAGCGASHKFARRLPNKSVAIIEPNERGHTDKKPRAFIVKTIEFG
uniref:Pyr_redox_2 domain-containing protein n=1 Tax=Heterorhabditis bacteriophora TaxID=37862 RepID=A0A1I7XE04_HETBA